MKELVEKNAGAYVNPHIMTIATLTGHAVLAVGTGYSVSNIYYWAIEYSNSSLGLVYLLCPNI